tara:strand:+ start:244 stop:600 length:357 start_codon:yes stop_codon:yes gene_type:complete
MSIEKHPAPVTGWFESFRSADGKTVINAFSDSCMGVSTTTETHVMRLPDGQVEARVGFAVMGPPNMSESQFEKCGHNPFHPEFRDNYASAKAATIDEALKKLAADLKNISDGLFADFD